MAAALAVFAGAVAQAVSGLGFVLVCGPALVLALGYGDGVRTAVMLALLLNIVMLLREYRGVHLRAAAGLLVGALAATPMWGWLLQRLPTDVAARAAGAATLVGVLALMAGWRLAAARGSAGAVVAGAVSSLMNVLAGVGGPAIALYARNADWSASEIRPTAQAYGVVLNVVTLAVIGPIRPSAGLAGLLLVAMGAGFLAGTYLTRRFVGNRGAQAFTLALAAVGGVILLLNGAG